MAIFDIFRKARPDRSASDEPARPWFAWGSTQRKITTYRQDVAATSALSHPVLFRCLKKIADSVASVDWYAEIDPDAAGVDRRGNQAQIKALNDLLKCPTDRLSPDMLRFWMALVFASYGRIPFKVGVSVSNVANGLYPLNPAYVTAETNDRGVVERYKYGIISEKSETWPSKHKAGEGKPFVHEIAMPGLSGTADGCAVMSPLGSLGLPASIITALLKRAMDTAEGHPNAKYIVATEKQLDKAQSKSVRQLVGDAAPSGDESGNILLLQNVKLDVTKLDNDLNNIHSKLPMDDMTRMIAGAFGIPIALLGLGAADGAKFAGNYEESRLSFFEDTVIPSYLSPIAKGLTAAICPPGVRIVFDYDSIPAIQYKRIKQARELAAVPFLTNNEKRVAVDYQPLDGDEHDRLPVVSPAIPLANDGAEK